MVHPKEAAARQAIRFTDEPLMELALKLAGGLSLLPWFVNHAASGPEAIAVYWSCSRDPVSMTLVLAIVDRSALSDALRSLKTRIVPGPPGADYIAFGMTWQDGPDYTKPIQGGGWFHDILVHLDCAILGLAFWTFRKNYEHLIDLALNAAIMTGAIEGTCPGPQHECVAAALCEELRRAMPVLSPERILAIGGEDQ